MMDQNKWNLKRLSSAKISKYYHDQQQLYESKFNTNYTVTTHLLQQHTLVTCRPRCWRPPKNKSSSNELSLLAKKTQSVAMQFFISTSQVYAHSHSVL